MPGIGKIAGCYDLVLTFLKHKTLFKCSRKYTDRDMINPSSVIKTQLLSMYSVDQLPVQQDELKLLNRLADLHRPSQQGQWHPERQGEKCFFY
jgi:hypothetical protein